MSGNGSAHGPGLFDPFESRGARARNRIGVSPMCQYCAGADARPTEWHLAHLLQRAVGGAGIVFAEATAVSAEGRITARDLGLYDDAQARGHARLAAAIARAGAVPAIQVAHAGRKASQEPPWVGGVDTSAGTGWTPLAPSEVAMDGMLDPRAMSEGDIAKVIRDVAATARVAAEAGYRIVELHAAHGYLLHQFLSPLSNRRNDAWGGDFDGRTRLARECAAAARAALPDDVSLWVRVSHTDWLDGGWTTEETVELARRLRDLGVDAVDVSSGGIAAKVPIPVGPGYQVPGAEAVRRRVPGLAVAAVGMITEAAQANAIVRSGRADVVLLARATLRDPYWPLRAAEALGRTDRLEVPPQYERGWGRYPIRGEVAEAFAPL